MRKSATPTKISLKEIKAAKNLTASQRFVLAEIHSLISRGKKFYAWNTTLAEKTGFKRSTVANALTVFYKKGVLKSKCEHNDSKTERITKRFITINYKKLALLLDIAAKPPAYEKQPLYDPSKEKPVFLTQNFEDIDFEGDEKTTFDKWSDYMISVLDRKTNIVNPTKREKNALKAILDDARRMINSSRKNETDKACSIKQLMYDRRVENAVFYCMNQMIKDEENTTYYGNEEWEVKYVDKSNLNYAWMRNIYKPLPGLFSKAITKTAEEGFKPYDNVDDDIFNHYHYNTGVAYSAIPDREENESNIDYLWRVRRLGFLPSYTYTDEWDYAEHVIEQIKGYKNDGIDTSDYQFHEFLEERQEKETEEINEEQEDVSSPLELMERLRYETNYLLDDFTDEEKEAIRKAEQVEYMTA